VLAIVRHRSAAINIGQRGRVFIIRGGRPSARLDYANPEFSARRAPPAPRNRLRFIVPSRIAHSNQMRIARLIFHKEYRFKQSSA
jgi:hypothetical protein